MDKAKILALLKTIGGLTAATGAILASLAPVANQNPALGIYIAGLGIIIHGISTAANELAVVFAAPDAPVPPAASATAPVETPKS